MTEILKPIGFNQILWRVLLLFIALSLVAGFLSQAAGFDPILVSEFYPIAAIVIAAVSFFLAKLWLWLELKCRRALWNALHKPEPENPCPQCGSDMDRTEKSSFSGNDMRTYHCPKCGHEEIRDYGIATWKAMSGDFEE